MDLGPPGACEQLRAQADAEDRLAGGRIEAGQFQKFREMRAGGVGIGVHRAAQDQQAVMARGVNPGAWLPC